MTIRVPTDLTDSPADPFIDIDHDGDGYVTLRIDGGYEVVLETGDPVQPTGDMRIGDREYEKCDAGNYVFFTPSVARRIAAALLFAANEAEGRG